MAGRRNAYIYYLYEGEKLVYKGLQKDLAKKLNVDQNRIYMSFKLGQQLLRKYTVLRKRTYE